MFQARAGFNYMLPQAKQRPTFGRVEKLPVTRSFVEFFSPGLKALCSPAGLCVAGSMHRLWFSLCLILSGLGVGACLEEQCAPANTNCSLGGLLGFGALSPLTRTIVSGPGASHTCIVFESGLVRCWGLNGSGRLGLGSTTNVGDGSGPTIRSAGRVPLGGLPRAIRLGAQHSCALYPDGSLRCWGDSASGQLGLNRTSAVGDGVGPGILDVATVATGGSVRELSAMDHTCAVLDGGALRCWGFGGGGVLGYNDSLDRGNGSGPSILDSGDVPVGAPVRSVATGGTHTCAVLESGAVRCWGAGGFGRLGYNNTNNVGDGIGVSILAAGDVPIGAAVKQIVSGNLHNCALLENGAVRCWGSGGSGQLGNNAVGNVGDGVGLSISAAGDVPLGAGASVLAAGQDHVCALLVTGAVRCWGANADGQLGYNLTTNVGDGVGPSIIAAGDVPLGGVAVQIAAGAHHTCALMADRTLYCWGRNAAGQLGYNNVLNVGASTGLAILAAGPVPYE